MEKYEYMVTSYDLSDGLVGSVEIGKMEKQLNLLGVVGWELVSCTSTNRSMVCIFKRKKD